jgi:hypothetical protein
MRMAERSLKSGHNLLTRYCIQGMVSSAGGADDETGAHSIKQTGFVV